MIQPTSSHFFTHGTASHQVREQLLTSLSDLSGRLYRDEVLRFTTRLSDFQRALYQEVRKIPYSSKDFWRDIHDIIVTSSVLKLVEASEETLPSWLVEAALLHDRGYALLSHLSSRGQASSSVGNYNSLSGAHWDGVDTRIAHSLYSLQMARFLFDGKSQDTNVDALANEFGIVPLQVPPEIREHQEDLLQVIQEHDYPLIGRYGEVSLFTRHHFDADSLFSISVTSFVKDYLYYLSDPSKMEKWREIRGEQGEEPTQPFQLMDLFSLRLNRYFTEGDAISDLLTPYLRKHRDGSAGYFEIYGTIRPHSAEALKLTEQAFLRLLSITRELEGVSSEVNFIRLVEDAARAELASM